MIWTYPEGFYTPFYEIIAPIIADLCGVHNIGFYACYLVIKLYFIVLLLLFLLNIIVLLAKLLFLRTIHFESI